MLSNNNYKELKKRHKFGVLSLSLSPFCLGNSDLPFLEMPLKILCIPDCDNMTRLNESCAIIWYTYSYFIK
jgi:hypothetical protein